MARASQIGNRNFLSPTGFKFTLRRAPKVSFFCNQANIPELTLGLASLPTYLKDIDVPGDKIIFGDLNLKFLIDEDLGNYMEIQNWIRGLGYPEKIGQYSELARQGIPQQNNTKLQDVYSDGTLQILNSNYISNFQIFFKDLFPYSLSTISFDATDTDIEYFTADVSFKYTVYTIEDIKGNPL